MTDEQRCDVPRHALLPVTQDVILRDLAPTDWLHVAEFLAGLLERRPLANGANDATGWRAERWILGSLAAELRQLAAEAGVDVPFVIRTFGGDGVERAIAEEDRRARLRGWPAFGAGTAP